ncbi:hypothetical protein STCU_11510 [Strigomonas culicis]|uniref:Uncharacterized protein n=1 Tax=Strigomonas culicis TaxID=28005 RepID=S9TGZ1_9TRYP|nr:hypothetical protein STCU_11510 [Strigomonas culicis]|eukprot:EPY16164.1 hypothetical protein STCU_11510 [Strigomonas culicis]
MIRFKYALQKSGGAASAVKATAAALGSGTVAAAGSVLLDSEDQLPARFRTHVFSEQEMETIMLGGAAPYVPKHLQKKRK